MIDCYTYGQGANSVLVVNRAIVEGLKKAGLLRHDQTPPLVSGNVDWDGVGRMQHNVQPGAVAAVCQAGQTLEVMKKIKEISPETKIVLQRDSTHCEAWKDLVQGEQDRFGMHWPVYGGGLLERELAEYQMADFITVLSRWVQTTFELKGLGPKVLHVGPQTFDRWKWKRKPLPSRRPFRVLFAGQLGLRKGLFDLLEAWKRLALPDAELMIAGVPEPSTEECHKEIYRRIEETPGVNRLGFVDIKQMPVVYTKAHLLVLPSVEEGSTMTGLESMSVCRPVVATFHAGIDVLRDGFNGFVVSPRNPDEIAEAILAYYQSSDLLQLHSENAAGSVVGCDVEEFGVRYVKVVSRALGLDLGAEG